jgi:hypothetical protein
MLPLGRTYLQDERRRHHERVHMRPPSVRGFAFLLYVIDDPLLY